MATRTTTLPQPDLPDVSVALQKVAQAIGAIAKNRRTEAQGGGPKFNFRGIDDVLNAVHDALAEHGVSFIPDGVTIHDQTVGQTRSGTAQQHLLATVHYKIVGPAGDFITAAVLAEAQDTSDKSASKLMSMAYKYLVIQTLSIPVEPGVLAESDQESTPRETGPALASVAQKREMWELAQGHGFTTHQLGAFAAGVLGKDKPRSGQAFLGALLEEEATLVLVALRAHRPEGEEKGDEKAEMIKTLKGKVAEKEAEYQNLSGPTEGATS